MSILTKPYEISVWTDEWDSVNNKFIEKRLGIIGSNTMTTLNRAIEPNLTRNVNGTKKLTFQMYKHYKDTITGEDVLNPFSDWLISERKVKLKYGTYIDENGEEQDRWYDFIIKNVNENSSNYLYTYQLEDALVQELSKNGFGVTLDARLMNNMGTAQELVETVLGETDWKVESEVFVQTVEEGLVYVNIPAGTYYHISDQEDLRAGVSETTTTTLPASTGLAFYSCCKNKPHRFQFIYLPEDKNNYNKEDISTDSRGIIDELNCQYYIDIGIIESTDPSIGYKAQESFFLPAGWTVVNSPAAIDKNGTKDTTISSWYRGKRYGFAQTAKYVPLLERYCNVYEKSGVEYYGYVDNEYTSPALLQNVITNTEFKGTSGWVGTYAGTTGNVKSSVGAKVESVYGRFIDGKFVSVIDDLSNGSYDEDNDYIAYLKVIFPARQSGNYPMLINTGFYDNRTLIKNTSSGDKWCFGYEFLDETGNTVTNNLDFVIQEVSYNTQRGNYNRGSVWATKRDGYMIFQNGAVSDEEFKEREVKLVVVPTNNFVERTIYIKNMYLYREVKNKNGETITPGSIDTEGVIDTKHYLFAKSQLDSIEDAEQLVYDVVNILDYNTYVPVYNTGAEKVRSVTAKESNYFNILQSIAETFECWIDLKIKRDELGAIEEKIVCLKNYIGKNNYACFRYGVNLKDIQRTHESKNIVTKLIVKQNSNEHGKNGFCTIARAGSNPTGENYIYDFSYFHNMGLLDARDYLGCVYYDINPFDEDITQTGKDLGQEHSAESYNLQNYFNRIKNINEKLAPIGEELAGLQADLVKYSAELRVQEGLRDAAANSLEETVDDFFALTGLLPTQISTENMATITCDVPAATADLTGSNALNSGKNWAQGATITQEQIGLANSTTWKFDITLSDTLDDINYTLGVLGDENVTTWNNEVLVCKGEYGGLTIEPNQNYLENGRYELSYKLQKSTSGGTLVCVGSHNQSFRNTEIWFDGIKTDSNIVYIDDDTNEHTVKIIGTFFNNSNDNTPKLCIQPNRGSTEMVSCIITDIKLKKYNKNASSVERSFYFQPKFTLTATDGTTETTSEKLLSCTIPADSHTATLNYSLAIVDTTATSVASLLTEYATYKSEYNKAIASIGNFNETTQTGVGLMYAVGSQKKAIEDKIAEQREWLDHKIALNKLFFTKYSRFIQEGTWMSEEYVDDDKYYVDAQSVMYDSCYPQVAYSINVLSLSGLPGYEYFDFEVGDKTFVEDYEFFGEGNKEEVVITEMSENLDDPSKNIIKVQNFKNQFQDLFQKITATVQQAQYSTGSYRKAVALAEADDATKGKFVADGLEAYGQKLGVAGQTTVIQDENGITLTDSATKDQMRLIGGAIMMSVEDEETGQRSWRTGLTPEGISASMIYAGTLNAGEIQIMNVKDPVFRWDAYGLSAFDANWQTGVIGTPNPYKFVRYDKYGIYGINFNETDEEAVPGTSWKPSSADEIDRKATFALTWKGLKVTNKNNTSLLIGDSAKSTDDSTDLITVKNSSDQTVFSVDENGTLRWSDASSPTRVLYAKTALTKPSDGYDWEGAPNSNDTTGDVWHKIKAATDWYATYTYNGGASWTDPIQFVGANTSNIKEWYYATSSSTETPLNPNDDDYTTGKWEDKWKDSPKDADHGAVKKYLWNYEETTLSNGAKIYTDPALISTQSKTVSKIYEFYIVTKSATAPGKPTFSSWNGTTLTYTNTNPAWEVVDTSNATSASTKTAAQSEYLWNFEVICYDDNTYSVGSTANIGTGGKGISTVTNWYKRTSTNVKPDKPTDGTDATGASWSKSVPAYSASSGNCFLWTCESTVYSDSTNQIYTAVSLLTREPRTIKEIKEYYKTIANGETDPTTGITLGANNNSVSNYNGWSTTLNSPAEGESLWNVELIEFATKDDEGANLYQVTAPARVGYVGVDSYTLSLDNDMDTIVQMSNGDWISGEITVTATGYKGHTQKTGLSSGNFGEISLKSVPSSWTENQHYTFTNNTLKFNPTGESNPKGVPGGFTEGEFVFQWKDGDNIYAEKTFSLKKITSLADYDLVIPQVVYNSSQSSGTITINVLKKTQSGTQTLTSATADTSIKLYQKSGEKYKPSDWSIGYAQYREDEIYFVLASADGELDTADSGGYATFKTGKTPSIIWDEETVEFTQDGAGIKKIDTDVRNYPYALPAEDGQTYSYAWTTPKEGSDTAFVDIGHEEAWSYKSSHDNSHIKIGDTAYLVGYVADRFSATGEKQSITLYGVVTDVASSSVTMKTSQVIWGGTKGDKGDNGTSPYTISLDEDFISIPCDKDGNFTAFTEVITPTIYSGKDVVTGWATRESLATDFYLVLTSSNLTAGWDSSKTKINVTNISADRGTFTLTLRKKNESTVYAITTFEAIKQKAGADGDPGEYVYSKATPNVIHSRDPEKIRIKTYKRTGSGDATGINFIGKYYLGNSTSGTNLAITNDNGNYYSDTISKTVVENAIANGNKKITVKTYKQGSNYAAASLYDSITIDLLTDGENGSNGTGIYALFHDKTSDGKFPAAPTMSWNNYVTYSEVDGNAPKVGWYTNQQEEDADSGYAGSVYICQKMCTADEEESTSWGPVSRISAVTATVTDILNALEGETEQGIIPYTDENGNTIIGINATAIHTGAINIGGTADKKYEDARFYANMDPDSPSVYIAGWTVDANQLHAGASLGQDSCFYLIPNGQLLELSSFDPDRRRYKMVVGNQFAIDEYGNLYCNGGKIGGWSITQNALSTTNNALYLGTTGIDADINNIKREDLVFKAGDNFGVTSEGVLYATNAILSGDISAESGKIGQFDLNRKTILGYAYKPDTGVNYNTNSNIYNVGVSAGWNGNDMYLLNEEHANDSISFFAGTESIITPDSGNGTVDADFMVTSHGRVFLKFLGIPGRSYGDNQLDSCIVMNKNGIYEMVKRSDGQGGYTPSSGALSMYRDQGRAMIWNDLFKVGTRLGSLETRLDDLGFKGPYTIKLLNTEVGKIYKLGTIVYGYLTPQHTELYKDDASYTADCVFYKDGVEQDLPGPVEAAQFIWHTIYYKQGVLSNKSAGANMEISSNNNKLKLTLKQINRVYGDNSTNAGRWTYFCYSTSDTLNQHPG